MGAEVTKEDINRIYDKIEPLQAGMARIEQKLDDMPKPQRRPCDMLIEHLDVHAESRTLWQKPAVANVLGLIRIAVVALVTWLLTKD